MTSELHQAKEVILLVLERSRDVENYEGTIFKREGFAKLVYTIEDTDPHWLVEHLRDPKYDKTVRAQVASYMRGVNANMLLLELLAD